MMEPIHVLVIDDERNLVNSLVYGLKNQGIHAAGAYDARSGLAALGQLLPDLVLLDVRLPDLSGIEVLDRLKAQAPDLPVVMISAYGDTRTAVEAVKAGAEDFLCKPFELDELVTLIRRTVQRDQLRREVSHHRAKADGGEILGQCSSIRALREQISVVARSSAKTVLLLGESGTGKALAARALHQLSPRAKGPFVEVNCASLPEQLLEAELFGAERGAYTGAYARRVGLAQIAHGGTLFLDEIGELPAFLQSKLLHFLESHRFRPIGANRERIVDVRVIAATNRDLEASVRSGEFRADLYYRLNVVPLTMPRLAERGEDVVLLAEHFAKRCAASDGVPPITFEPAVCGRFRAYPWPGNVRELKNLIERLTILYPGQRITSALLPPELRSAEPRSGGSLEQQLAETERDILLRVLAAAGGRKGRAAEALGISRHALKRRLQRLGIS